MSAHMFSAFIVDTVRVQNSNVSLTYTILPTSQNIFFVYLCLIKHSSHRNVLQGVFYLEYLYLLRWATV
jgi:hypothetical protein